MSWMDKWKDENIFEAVEANPITSEDLALLNELTRINSFSRMLTVLDITCASMIRALEVILADDFKKRVLKIYEKLENELTKVTKSITSALEVQSFNFSASLVLISAKHLLEMIEQVLNDLIKTGYSPRDLLPLEVIYNVLRVAVLQAKASLDEVIDWRDQETVKKESEALERFRSEVVNALWNFNEQTIEEKVAIVVVVVGFIRRIAELLVKASSIVLKEGMLAIGGKVVGEEPSD